MKQLEKATKFLDIMVKTVFFSTFIFTAVILYFVWNKDWEGIAHLLVERWFTIMVGELIIMGFIQIVKEFASRRREE